MAEFLQPFESGKIIDLDGASYTVGSRLTNSRFGLFHSASDPNSLVVPGQLVLAQIIEHVEVDGSIKEVVGTRQRPVSTDTVPLDENYFRRAHELIAANTHERVPLSPIVGRFTLASSNTIGGVFFVHPESNAAGTTAVIRYGAVNQALWLATQNNPVQ